jgi:hypothetical protein
VAGGSRSAKERAGEGGDAGMGMRKRGTNEEQQGGKQRIEADRKGCRELKHVLNPWKISSKNVTKSAYAPA